MMHRHVWKIVSQVEHPSSVEAMRAAGTPITMTGGWPEQVNAVTRRRVIVTARCSRCGTEKVYRA